MCRENRDMLFLTKTMETMRQATNSVVNREEGPPQTSHHGAREIECVEINYKEIECVENAEIS